MMGKQILIAAGAVVVIVAIVVGWYLLTQRHVRRLVSQGEGTNVLLLGLETTAEANHSDAVMVLSVAPESDVSLVSLPCELRVKFDDGAFRNLNAAYALVGGAGACEIVSAVLGVEVLFYIAIGYESLERLINDLGGVTMTVEERMRYDDESTDPPLHIDIQPGTQTLDGKTALDYVRYRDKTGDLGRIARQQKLVAALLKKGFQRRDFASMRKIVKTVYPYLQTDLSLIDLYDLAELLQGKDFANLRTATVPATPVVIEQVLYLEPQVVETERLVARLIKRIDLLTPEGIRVAVFNGNGVRMLATHTAEYLRKRHFEITRIANAESFTYDKTYIVTLTEEAKAYMLLEVLPRDAVVVTPEEFKPHYAALAPIVPPQTDLLLIAGAGFEVGDG